MELTYNNGTTFFNIESPDFIGFTKEMKNVNRLIAKDVISFSVTEEMGKLVSGTLALRDATGIYSKVFRNGVKFALSWGYKAWNVNSETLNNKNLTSRGIRQGINCLIQTPSGAGDEGGQTTYNVTFYGLEFLDKKKNRIFDHGTKRDLISQCLQELDVLDTIIDFPNMNQILTNSNSVRQRESNFSFMFRLAVEYGCFYQIGYKPDNTKIAVFIDSKKVDSASVKRFLRSVTNADNEKELFYNSGGVSNVRSYTWQQHIGENGQGDGVRITYVEGKPVFERFVAEGGHVLLWRLNRDKVSAYIKEKGNLQDEAQATLNIANAKTFDEVKKFFDPVDTPFAPQGQGFTVNCSVHGDPFLTALLKIKFGGGFPSPLMHVDTIDAMLKFYIRRVTHTFSKNEYTSEIEICDSYNLNGSYVAPENLSETIR
jgi:hypothetical protein